MRGLCGLRGDPGAVAVRVIVTGVNNLVSVGSIKSSFLRGFVNSVVPLAPSMGLHLVDVCVGSTFCSFLEGPDDALKGVAVLTLCKGVG